MLIKQITVKSGNMHTNPLNERDSSLIECELTATVQEGENVAKAAAILQSMADTHVQKARQKCLQDAEKNVKIASLESDIENMKAHQRELSEAIGAAENMVSDLMEVKDDSQPELPWDEAETDGPERIDVIGGDSGHAGSEDDSAGVMGDNTGRMVHSDDGQQKKAS